MGSARSMRVVLVEDEASDVLFMRKAFERGQGDYNVVDVASAESFTAHLADCKAKGESPDLVLLDLNLPDASGLDVLRLLRHGDAYPHVVVIVLTSSSYKREVDDVYRAGANAFVTKPARLAELDEFVGMIETFWFGLVKLPYQ